MEELSTHKKESGISSGSLHKHLASTDASYMAGSGNKLKESHRMSSGSAFSGFDTNTKQRETNRHNQSQSIPKFKPDIDVSNISLLESQTRVTTETKMLSGMT